MPITAGSTGEAGLHTLPRPPRPVPEVLSHPDGAQEGPNPRGGCSGGSQPLHDRSAILHASDTHHVSIARASVPLDLLPTRRQTHARAKCPWNPQEDTVSGNTLPCLQILSSLPPSYPPRSSPVFPLPVPPRSSPASPFPSPPDPLQPSPFLSLSHQKHLR